MIIDLTNKKLINLIQQDFPLVRNPFAQLGKKIGINEEECIKRIKYLKSKKIIREISGIFDTQKLGYRSALAAMQIEDGKIEKAAKIISGHPGVSHNYQRNHLYNLWFTLSVPRAFSLKRHLDKLSQLTGASKTFFLPTIKLFKIGVNFDLNENKSIVKQEQKIKISKSDHLNSYKINRKSKEIIVGIQQDLKIVPQPFDAIAAKLKLSSEDFLGEVKKFQDKGILRRYGAVIKHRNAGFKANAMVVWKINLREINRVGNILASYNAVSHCYQRPTYPAWPYPLFTMIHGRKKTDCEKVIKDMVKNTGINEYLILYSTKEFKKERIKYFSPEITSWQKKMFKQ